MKRKVWIVLALTVVLLGGIYCFREPLMVRLFPKMVLSGAIGDAFIQLEDRFADSPVHLLTNALDRSRQQKVHLKLDTATEFMGIAHYDLELSTQTGPNRVSARGTVSTGAGLMDLKLYLDEDFCALASDAVTDGDWYGITYGSFPADIRSFQLLGLILGEDTLQNWDASVENLSAFMGGSDTIPRLRVQDVHTALLGALALKPQVAAEEEKHSYSVAFSALGTELAQMTEDYLDQVPLTLADLINAMQSDPDSRLKVVFHLQRRKLAAVDVALLLSGASYEITVCVEGEPLRAELLCWDGENLDRRELTVQTVSDENVYQEKLVAKRTINGVQSQFSADYSWDLSSGDMILDIMKDGKKYPVRLNLAGEGQSFTVNCQEFEKLLSLLTGKEQTRNSICTMTVSPGAPVPKITDFNNLSDWSLEDFYLLMTRIGNLVGIKLP